MQLSPHAWPLLQTLQQACLGKSGSAIPTSVSPVNTLLDGHSEKVGVDPTTVPAPKVPRPRARLKNTKNIQRFTLVMLTFSIYLLYLPLFPRLRHMTFCCINRFQAASRIGMPFCGGEKMTPAWAQRQAELLSDCIVSPDVFMHMVDQRAHLRRNIRFCITSYQTIVCTAI